ncbi:MAG: MG2 domain-containing protein [Planctomycetota bacterium]
MPRSLKPFSFVVFLFLALTAAALGDALHRGEEALIRRRYGDAVVALQQALAEATPQDRERVLLLLGSAQHLAGDGAGATTTYRRLVEEAPTGYLRAKARFRLADTLAASGAQRDASVIYREEVERLISEQRKEEVAETYLGLAEKALQATKPDFARAVTFFDLALDLGLSPDKARATRLRAADARLSEGNAQDAIARLQPLVRELDLAHGKLKAMLLLGQAKRAANDRAGARATFADLIALARDSEEAAEAAYLTTLAFGVPAPEARDVDRAVAALAAFAQTYPGHPKAKVAQFLVAECLRHVGRSDAALAQYRAFVATHGREDLPEVAAARATIGDVLAAQGKLSEAVEAWQAYLAAHPAHQEWERVQRAIVDTEWGMATAAFERGYEAKDFADARQRLDAFARAYPLDERNPEALRLFGDMLLREKKFTEAVTAFERGVKKYPGKEASGHAQFQIGEIYETELFDYHAALEAYRKVTWSSFVGKAKARIARLERKHLELKTERTFRTGEKARFAVLSRNVEKLRVRVFRLDMETYFRAMHGVSNFEALDIEVIEADKTFEHATPEYKRYRQTSCDIDIGMDGAGAYVVKVDDGELQATTVVLVTDIGVIAKTSRHELFVFTQNLKEERVEGGVKVVVSDGAKVVAEGQTGTDGVYRFRGAELKDCTQLRVFAVSAAGSGAGVLDLSGLGYSTGLQPVGFLFTDRPLYEPGQVAHVKGIVREVKDGLYALPAGGKYRVQAWSAGGRLLLQREVAFSPFGTFAVDVPLPAEAELGDYRVGLDRGEGETFTASFTVAHYERPKLTMDGVAKTPVVYRGERIEGTFTVRYFFGEPAAGKRVHYFLQMPDGARVEGDGVTNALGEVTFAFDSQDFAEEALAVVQADVVEEGVQAICVVPIATTEFAPVLSTVRDVYLAGERFDLDVELKDRAGKPLARTGEAVLLRREKRYSGIAEVEVARQSFTTTAADGKARVAFTAAKGGDHVLRVEARDRFGVLVTAQMPVLVSGDEDQVKLRLLSDRESYKVGEKVAVKVMNRAGAHLVLQTVQGDGILAYRAFVLPAGESTLGLDLAAAHAPNFALGLSMIAGTELFTAEREFRVARDLEVVVTSPAKVTPGSKLPVQIQVSDAEGRPAVAEVALAVVDEALLALKADATPRMADVFWGKRRETSFRTVSSCDWSYRGAASPVSQDLAAEERRREAPPPAVGGAPGPAGPSTPGPASQRDLANLRADTSVAQDVDVLETEQAFQSLGWNTAVGLGGGAGGRYAGGRQRAVRTIAGYLDQSEGPSSLQLLSANAPWDQDARLAELGRVMFFAAPSDGGERPDRPRTSFSETGAWLSAITTGPDGKATAEVTLPDSTTTWRLVARGVTAASDVGESNGSVQTSKRVQADLVAPMALVQGDQLELRVRAHNLTDDARDARVELRVPADADPVERSLRLEAHGEGEASVSYSADRAGNLTLRAQVQAGSDIDALERPLVVEAFGRELRAGRTGSTREAEHFTLALPQGEEYLRRVLSVAVGPDLGRDLVAAALGLGYQPWNCRRIAATNLALASRGLSALLVLDWLQRSGGTTPSDVTRLRALAAAHLASLAALQRPDGGYGWVKQCEGDVRTTSQVLAFATWARRLGLVGATELADKASEWLLRQLRSTRERPRALLALALAGRARFEDLNALHRERAGLDLDALARLALAWHAAERPTLAAELSEGMRGKLAGAGTPGDAAAVEAQALAVAALLRGDARDPAALRALATLRQARIGDSYGTPEATTAVLWAETAAGGRNGAAASEGEVTISVNGRELAKVPATARTDRSSFTAPSEWLKDGDNEVEIRVAGRADVHFQATLVGFAAGFPAEPRAREVVRIERTYLAAERRFDGKVVAPGFGVVQGTYKTFDNTVSRVEAGQTARGRLRFWVPQAATRSAISPLVVEEPIPAGCSVTPGTVRGSFDHVVIEPTRLTFYYREGNVSDTVTYELQARFPGTFRALPTQVYGALAPHIGAYGKPGRFTVDARGQGQPEPYRETPDELYHIGKALFDNAMSENGDFAAAGERLHALVREWQTDQVHLRDDVRKDVTRMLLFVSIASHDAQGTVRFFEELKDTYADLVIPFDKIVAVGQAYVDLGEFERALMVFRATAEASFLKDAAVANTLDGLGEVAASVRFLTRLLGVYPDLNLIRTGLYSVAQRQADAAAKLQPGAAVDPRVGSAQDLRAAALAGLREFLVLYPDDPLAEEVAFALATTHVEAKDLAAALAVSERALETYPGSVMTDEFLYTAGYADFALGKPEAAFAILKRVAEEDFPQRNGGKGPSENKDHAIYLQGQIHHALGQPEPALAAYEKVKDKFSDAAEATDYFLRKRLSLPEVTTVATSEPAKVEVSFRNVARAAVTVYRVDLMRLYLLEKSLNDIRGVKLHGIRPHAELTVELGSGRDYKLESKPLELSLDEPGAYLIVLRGDDLLATGMLLRSDLRIEAQEAFDVGRVRVYVKAEDAVVADAHVKVVGSADQQLRSGDTDLRGVFVADAVVGQATVLVKKGDEYAFYRGSGVHQPSRVPAPQPQRRPGRPVPNKAADYKSFDAFSNNMRFNDSNRAQQVQWLRNEVLQKQQKGVEVYRAK